MKHPLRFQSTHPCGVRRAVAGRIAQGMGFNPRTRVGCDNNNLSDSIGIISFNPRTRVGCDGGVVRCARSGKVSIHAPVWGATPCHRSNRVTRLFQSTHPCGVRPKIRDINRNQNRFQSTHPCGVRLALKLYPVLKMLFQSTHPCGVRLHNSPPSVVQDGCFNPRTRVGCDQTHLHGQQALQVSIHAPVWGATRN